MDPPLGGEQGDQAQNEQPKQEIVSRGVNDLGRINRLFPNPANKIGLRAATRAGLGVFRMFFAGGMGFPVVVALGLVLLFTIIIIMGFGGASPSEPNNQAIGIPPTGTTTPTMTPNPPEP